MAAVDMSVDENLLLLLSPPTTLVRVRVPLVLVLISRV